MMYEPLPYFAGPPFNAIITLNMGTVTSSTWVNDSTASAQAQKANACWKYLKTGSDYLRIENDDIINVCSSLTISETNPYSSDNYKIIVTLTAEMLQYENVSW